MTREDALEIWLPIIKMGVKSMSECSEALDMAITALKQEPCAEVLDKIREEVCDIDDKIVLNSDSLYERKAYVRFIEVIDIIDKYKAEAEGGTQHDD